MSDRNGDRCSGLLTEACDPCEEERSEEAHVRGYYGATAAGSRRRILTHLHHNGCIRAAEPAHGAASWIERRADTSTPRSVHPPDRSHSDRSWPARTRTR